LRYDIDANFRVLAEWLGPGLPARSDLSCWLIGLQESCEYAKRPLEISNYGVVENRGGGQLDFPDSPID